MRAQRLVPAFVCGLLVAACSSSGSNGGPCDTSGPGTASLTLQAGGDCSVDSTFTFTHEVTAAEFICQRTPTELKVFGWDSDSGGLARWVLTLPGYDGAGTYTLDAAAAAAGANLVLSFEAGVVICSTWQGEVWLNPSGPDSSCELAVTSDCHVGGGDAGTAYYHVQGTLSCTITWDVTPGTTYTVTGTFDLPRCLGG